MSHTIEPIDTAGAVAIVGMAGRFPGARDVAQFWANLAAGVDSITVLGDPGAHDPAARSWRVSAGGVIEDIDLFDADFFGVPPAEAAWMDPQHRLFLECAWLALEDAGCDPAKLPGAVAVYAGTNINSYVLERLGHLAGKDAAQFMQILVGNEKDFLATRVSYKLNLRGESVTVQTSCSTSLVALHLACQSLLSGQSDHALAGGVSVRVPQIAEYTYDEGLIASPDGRCRPFDHRACGTVPGSGMGVVVLKRLEDAIADRDHCYAVIRGSWINNDGRGKVGFTAPAVEGQAEVIARALAMAGVAPDTIRFVETHGTGTPIGDPIEFEALRRAFRQDTRRRACALGALKANIGHLDTAAGIAGLMKTALALHHRLLPPSPHFERANPALDFENSPFYINTEAEPWQANGVPRRAAVSSFGVGGTNVHVVLEEAPARLRSAASRPVQIVTLSARTAEALRVGASALAGFVEAHPEVELRDVAFTRNVGRQHFAHRRFVVGEDGAALATALRADALAADVRGAAPAVVFMFPGQGAQHVGMAVALYEHEPRFREAIDACLGHAERHGAVHLRGLMGLAGSPGGAAAEEQLARPEHALPALLAVEYALVQTWKAWGVVPSAVIGHSYGELAAACVAGLFGLEEAVVLAIERGRLMQRMPPGRMLAVPLSEAEAARWTGPQVAIAAVNADERVVLSGPAEAMEALHGDLREAGIAGHWLPVPFAYHSPLLEPLLGDYSALVGRARPGALGLRCLSNLTADWLTPEEACDAGYWARQMRQPVRFAAGLRKLREAGHALFLEVGPGQTLSTLARQVLGREATVCASLARVGHDWRSLLEAVGRLWSAGAPIAWRELERGQQGWSVPLPGYGFARQRHWIETAPPPGLTADAGVSMVREEAPPPPAPLAAVPPPRSRSDRAERGTPEFTSGVPEDGDAFRREVERRLAEIWSEVLGRPEVGVHDNFFELGGDSLTATRILARLQAVLPVSVTLEQVLVWPTIAELAEALHRGEPAAAAPAPARGPAVLSHAQEWLWTQQRLVPTSPAYHLPLAVRLRGPFDSPTFSRALGDVVGRQESLRTVFVAEDGRPEAVVQPAAAVTVPVVDLSACRPDAQEALARRAAQAEIARLFDMAQAAPWRAAVMRLGADDHVVLFVLHHIITDAWSMAVLVNEVTSAYVARRTGSAAPLPALPLQYGQYAQQQRDRLEREGQDLAAYWKRQLADVPPLLTLSARPRPPMKSYHGGRHAFRVEPEAVERLAALARDQQATLFMVTMAAYQALLFRMTGQEDFCVGAPTAGRVRRETEPIIGCFIDTLPIRADLRGDPTFLELLGRVRRTTLDAFAHQALPFGRIVQEVRPARSPSHTPLFQVILDFNSTPPPSPPQFPELVVEPFGAPQPTAKTDLIVDLWRGTEGDLRGAIEYDRALFGAADTERFASAFLTLLQAAGATPEARVSTLSIESEADRARRAEAARERDAVRRERLAAIKGGRQSHATDSH